MSDATLYFGMGWEHILSFGAIDHLLFILALMATYLLRNWQQVLILITAFTVGHSLTLALSVYNIISFNQQWVEFLIPCTIIVTALSNLNTNRLEKRNSRFNYLLALMFGLVHGMGFASTIRFMLAKDQTIALPLLSFNIGLEVGQVIVVICILLIGYLLINKLKLPQKWWVWSLSMASVVVGLKMAVSRWPL